EKYQLMPWPQSAGEDPAWSLQHDGPAHLIEFFRQSPGSDREDQLSLLIDALNAAYKSEGRDLWEEVDAEAHLFTLLMQLDALIGLHAPSTQALAAKKNTRKIESDLESAISTMRRRSPYRHPLAHYGLATDAMRRKIHRTKPKLLDSSLFGAFVNMHDSSRAVALNSLRGYDSLFDAFIALDEAFSKEYPVNHASPQKTVLWGRYPLDPYNGNPYSQFIFTNGNPWVIASLWRSRFLLVLAADIEHSPTFVWDRGAGERLLQHLEIDTHDREEIVAALQLHAKDQFQRVTSFLTAEAPAPEQLDRVTGKPQGVQHLAWSAVEIFRTAQAVDPFPTRDL
ncbi:MAG: hypothetical protein KDD66_00005, partial [Bdellovibrionales bacterium]|nr:hypothetical protein [Bdellovibrionales bacterium]